MPLQLSTKGSSFSLDDENSNKSSQVADAAINYKQASDLWSLSRIITQYICHRQQQSQQYLTIWPNNKILHIYIKQYLRKDL